MDNLTDKQQRFVEEYCVDWNATQAALRAGYAESGARQEGSRLLSNAVIESEIKKKMSCFSMIAGINAIRNLRALSRIAYSNITDFYDAWDELKDLTDIPEELRASIAEIHFDESTNKYGASKTVKLKLHSKISAIQELNKMIGGYKPDRIDHTTGGQPIHTPQMAPIILGINPYTLDQEKKIQHSDESED